MSTISSKKEPLRDLFSFPGEIYQPCDATVKAAPFGRLSRSVNASYVLLHMLEASALAREDKDLEALPEHIEIALLSALIVMNGEAVAVIEDAAWNLDDQINYLRYKLESLRRNLDFAKRESPADVPRYEKGFAEISEKLKELTEDRL